MVGGNVEEAMLCFVQSGNPRVGPPLSQCFQIQFFQHLCHTTLSFIVIFDEPCRSTLNAFE